MMRSAAVLIVFTFNVQGQSIPKRSGVGVHTLQQSSTPQQQRFAPSRFHPSAPFIIRASQERIAWDHSYSHNVIQTLLQAEAEAAPASTPEYVNIYEEALEKCAEDAYCPYRSAAIASHDICSGIRTSLAVEKYGMAYAAAEMESDCISVLSFGSKSKRRLAEGQGFYFIPKCSALPAGVLDSTFSTDMMKGVPMKVTERTVGIEQGSVKVTTETTDVKVGLEYMGSQKTQFDRATRNFRLAINTICALCAEEAPNEKAKEMLEASCAKIKALEASERDDREKGACSVFLACLVSAFVAGGAAFTLLWFRGGARLASHEPFLNA